MLIGINGCGAKETPLVHTVSEKWNISGPVTELKITHRGGDT